MVVHAERVACVQHTCGQHSGTKPAKKASGLCTVAGLTIVSTMRTKGATKTVKDDVLNVDVEGSALLHGVLVGNCARSIHDG